jgi:hypothetical protein
MALSFIMNEYVNIDRIETEQMVVMESERLAVYEPIELRPVVKGSLRGHIYNGDEVIPFRVSDTGVILKGGFVRLGTFNNTTGVIKIFYNKNLHEENFLCVSYEHGEDEPQQKSNWLQEGF